MSFFGDSLAVPTISGLTMADFLGLARLQPTTNNANIRRLVRRRFSPSQEGSPPDGISSLCPVTRPLDNTNQSTGALDNRSALSSQPSHHTRYSSSCSRGATSKSLNLSPSSLSSPLVWISLVLALISCSLSQVTAIPSHQIHTQMGEKELQQIFQVDSQHQVPEYQVVSISSISRSKRSIDEDHKRLVSFNAFGKDVKLQLRRNPHLVKQSLRMWIAEPDSSKGIHYKELTQDAEEEIGEAYQDENNQAALLIHHDKDDGSLLMDGMVGTDLVVKPVPSGLRGQVQKPDDDEAFLDDELADDWVVKKGFPVMNDSLPITTNNNTQGMHIIYKAKHINSHSDYALMEPDQDPFKSALRTKRHAESKKREKRDAPYVIYPEILVIVDYDGYRLHGGDNLQVKRYFVSFWNGVDLRYKILRGPKVRISIAGIIISRGRDATPYLERNRVGRDALDSASALTDLGKYLFQERRLPVYDIAVVVTKYDMCRRREGGRCSRGTAGFAYVGGACVVNKRLEKVNSVAIVEDTGGFSGIIVAAHEVGHLLGCVHDGSPAPSYLGGPGAQKCRWEDGYIMSDLRHTERGFQWSACSIAQFHHFLNGDTATCLYNSPHEDSSLPRVLPGKLLSLDAQCRKDRGTSACFKDDRVCAQLFCFDATSGYCVAYRPAAEGSPCGDGHQHCVSGRCVIEHENIIPDYSQITPAVVRGDAYGKSSSFAFPTSSSNLVSSTTTPRAVKKSATTTTTRKPKQQSQLSKKSGNPSSSTSGSTKPISSTKGSSSASGSAPTSSPKKSKHNHKNARNTTTAKPTHSPKKSSSTPSPTSSRTKSTGSRGTTTSTTTTNTNNNKNNSRRSQRPSPKPTPLSKPTNKPDNPKPLTEAPQRGRSSDSSARTSSQNSISKAKPSSTTTPKPQIPSSSTSSPSGGGVSPTVRSEPCEDRLTRIGGSYNCRDFLTRYGYKYCSSPYIHRNCCAAHKVKCIQRRR